MRSKGIALVTGGSRRLGRAIAVRLAEGGYDVVVHYRSSTEEASKTVDLVRAAGRTGWAFAADLISPKEIAGLFERVERECGGLNALINSAASFECSPLAEISVEDWDRVMSINLRAPWLCLREALPLLQSEVRTDSTSAVINIADLSGTGVWPGYTHHGVSKAGLLHFTRCAARELAPRVRVNAVIPGMILPPAGEKVSRQWLERGTRVPVGRSGTPSEVGDAVFFLVESQFTTGVTLHVDGGESLLSSGGR